MNSSSRSIFLPRSPLIHVLAEIRFSPVLAMEARIPEIQDALRRKGFPLYECRTVPILRFDLKSNPSIDSQMRWDFLNADRTLAVFLSTNFVVVHSTRFRVFDDLSASVEGALAVIDAAARIGLVDQLGLRYVNLVRPFGDEQVSEYLSPGLLGLSIPQFKSATHRYETIASKPDESRMAVRCLQNYSGEYLPPDLSNENLDHNVVLARDSYACILDLDHSMERRAPFQLPSVLNELGSMHDNLDVVFRTAVTPFALETWRRDGQ